MPLNSRGERVKTHKKKAKKPMAKKPKKPTKKKAS